MLNFGELITVLAAKIVDSSNSNREIKEQILQTCIEALIAETEIQFRQVNPEYKPN